MTDVNIPLLRKAVEWVEEQDKLPARTREWYQPGVITKEDVRVRAYLHQPGCGTAYCVAGYIATVVDDRFSQLESLDRWGNHFDPMSGRFTTAISTATTALGLSDYSHGLFRSDNTAADIRRIAEEIAGEPL